MMRSLFQLKSIPNVWKRLRQKDFSTSLHSARNDENIFLKFAAIKHYSMPAISFFTESISYSLPQKLKIKKWVKATIEKEGYQLQELNFIFCSDEYLLSINQQYLNHDTYTDIITFDNSEEEKLIISDIFISIERVKENAKTYKTSTFNEVCRIMIHGTLHLLGYKDKGKAAKTLMTQKEDEYLAYRSEFGLV